MIRIDKQLTFPEVPDVTVWQDHIRRNMFYALPQSPRFRLQNECPYSSKSPIAFRSTGRAVKRVVAMSSSTRSWR